MTAVKTLASVALLAIACAAPAAAQSSHCWRPDRGLLACQSQETTKTEVITTLCGASSIDARCKTFRDPKPLPSPWLVEKHTAPKAVAGR
jgi:hypothetical protein